MIKGETSPAILAEGERFGVVGGGNMSKALLFPLFDRGLLKPEQVSVSAKTESTLAPWKEYGCLTSTDNNKITSESDIVLWGVKPQVFSKAVTKGWNMSTAAKYTKGSSLHISVMAGITLETFTRKLKDAMEIPANNVYNLRTARTMPNIGSKVGCGVVVAALGENPQAMDKQVLDRFFKPLGLYFEVDEHLMNAYSSLFGCGIGYMFPVLEAMSDGAVKMGVPRAISLQIAAQTMKGAGELLLRENMHPGALKDTVCSPGGTTIAGIAELERHGVRNAFIAAIEASTKRSNELSKI